MNVREEIGKLLEQWMQLTRAEATAIQTAAWISLQNIHTAKVELQKSLELARHRWSVENPGISVPPDLQAKSARLISLEARNADLLAAQLRRARQEQGDLEQSQRTLRKIQRSYTPGLVPTAWQCYS